MSEPAPTTIRRCLGEVLGTFLLVFFGCGVVHAAVLTGAQVGLWQLAIVWGAGIAVAVYCVGRVSGAHLNPAITLAFVVYGRCSSGLAIPYIASQVIGAMLAACSLLALFNPALEARERELGLARGQRDAARQSDAAGEQCGQPDQRQRSPRDAAQPGLVAPRAQQVQHRQRQLERVITW